jgi:hypothetical protein
VRQASADGLDISDHRYLANRLIRRLNLARRAVLRPRTMAMLARLSEPSNQRRMLFVVGAARSGTTAMGMALNGSHDVFLLTEANLFRENLMPGFRQRYNARHRANGLPPSKHFECPAVAPENATWVEMVTGLLASYRLVGEKVAFGYYQSERYVSEYLAFQYRHFHRAAYILMFRNPRDAILSTRAAFGIQNLAPWALSFIAAMRGLIRLRRYFPRTVPVFLETVGRATYKAIEQCVAWGMPGLATTISSRPESPRLLEQVPTELHDTVAELEVLYSVLHDAIETLTAAEAEFRLDSIDACLDGLRRRVLALR